MRLYFLDVWNIVDLTCLAIFFGGFCIRFHPHLTEVARALYCITASVCIVRIVDFFCVSPRLGPFVHIIGKLVGLGGDGGFGGEGGLDGKWWFWRGGG